MFEISQFKYKCVLNIYKWNIYAANKQTKKEKGKEAYPRNFTPFGFKFQRVNKAFISRCAATLLKYVYLKILDFFFLKCLTCNIN